MKITLMTLNMVIPILADYIKDRNMEKCLRSYEEAMAMLADAGYTHVDVCSFETKVLGMETVRKVLEKYGMGVGCFICFASFAADNGNCVEAGLQAVDHAANLGTQVVMLVPDAEGTKGKTPEQIRQQLSANFAPVAAYARENGLHPVVEDTPDLQLHFCRAEDVLQVLDCTPGLEVVYDSGNMLLVGEDPVEYLEKVVNRTAHIHLKDMRLARPDEEYADMAEDGQGFNIAPVGTGLVDLGAVIRKSKELGYNGWYTLEFSQHPWMDMKTSLVRSREYIEMCLST